MPAWTERMHSRLKRRPAWLGLIGVVVLGLVGFSMRAILLQREDETWGRIQREGVLRVGLDPSFPPFEVDVEGQIVGFDVALAGALASRWGVTVQFVPVHFDGLIDGLLAEQYDLILSAFPYDERLTQDVVYSRPYFYAGQVLVVRLEEVTVESMADLAGRRLAVEWGSGGDVEARRLQRKEPFEIIPFETAAAALEAVQAGQADAALVDAVSAYAFRAGQDGVRIVGEPLTDERYVIVVRPGSPRLLQEIDAALLEFQQSGLLASLQSEWFGRLP